VGENLIFFYNRNHVTRHCAVNGGDRSCRPICSDAREDLKQEAYSCCLQSRSYWAWCKV